MLRPSVVILLCCLCLSAVAQRSRPGRRNKPPRRQPRTRPTPPPRQYTLDLEWNDFNFVPANEIVVRYQLLNEGSGEAPVEGTVRLARTVTRYTLHVPRCGHYQIRVSLRGGLFGRVISNGVTAFQDIVSVECEEGERDTDSVTTVATTRPSPRTTASITTDANVATTAQTPTTPDAQPGTMPAEPQPTPGPLEVMQQQFDTLKNDLAALRTQFQDLKRCSAAKLGYKFAAGDFFKLSHRSMGTLSTVRFVKRQEESVLRLAFESTFNMNGNGEMAFRLFFQVDGEDCSDPSKVEYSLYENQQRGRTRSPVVVRGVCRATRRGPIARGPHTITVNIDAVPGYWHRDLDVESGWGSAKFTEVQEACSDQ